MMFFTAMIIRSWNSMRVLLLLVCMAFFSISVFADDESTDRENKIKIAYLFHFGQFTEWAEKTSVFTYCVYDDTRFTQLLKQAYTGKKRGNLPVDVVNIAEKSNVENCQILYFPTVISTDLLTRIHKKPILSVGSQKVILEQGIIYLFEDEQKIHFYINNTNALESSLKVSSQLLALSKDAPQ
jgi:hypothetical protein